VLDAGRGHQLRGDTVEFRFSDHTLNVDRRELRRGRKAVAVEPQVFDLLVYLLHNRDHVVSKDDLIASVWGGRVVSDSTLTSRINAARKAVGDSGEEQRLIRTFAHKGFRFVGEVRAPAAGESAQAQRRPTTCTSCRGRRCRCRTVQPSPYCPSPT
jgi:DNA-binding winged helix-turn-helix (wHTH) protein